jgi:serine/threonine-protein kinase
MGVVYLAQDTRLHRRVALKVLAPDRLDEQSRERLRAEALILSSLSHPNIATVFDFGCEKGVDYLVMEFVPGTTMDELLGSAPFATERVAALGVQLAHGLAAAHTSEIVHRDIKPGNLRVTPEGFLKILDFGVATSPSMPDTTDTTEAGVRGLQALVGTLRYMAPERLRGAPADARADVFAAGVVLFEMACGKPPYNDPQPIRLIESILTGHCPRPRTVNSKVDAGLEVVILRAISADPIVRYRNGMELAAALEPLVVGRGRPSGRLQPVKAVTRFVGRLSGLLPIAGTV